MREADMGAFFALLDDVGSLLLRPGQAMTATSKAMFFRAMSEYGLPSVRAAFDAHVKDPQRGKFMPLPADLIAQIIGAAVDDGRLGAEEAWATAIVASDERATVVWTGEIAQAWEIARPVFERGDEIAARMAFREAYSRLVAQARAAREPMRWRISVGHDVRQREAAIQAAVTAGRLGQAELADVPRLDAPAPTPLLARLGAMIGMPSIADRSRETLRHTADELRKISAGLTTVDTAERDRMQALKAESAAKAETYAAKLRQEVGP